MELPHIVIDYPSISAAATSARRRASITGVKMTRKGAYSSATAMCPKTIKSRWGEKLVWIWTENKQVMTAAVERGWNTFIFPSAQRDLAAEWSALAFISPLFIEDQDGEVLDAQDQRVGVYKDVSSPPQLENLQSLKEDHLIIVHLRDWQVIPAENIVAAFHNKNTVLAISNTPSEAQIFLQALELGLDGVVLKVEDVNAVLEMKDYFDKRVQSSSKLELTKVTVTNIQTCGMGDRVCVDLCSIMSHGEGLLVGSFARGLFLVHSECLESNYISSRPFRVNAGPVHAYVATPGGKTKYLSELNTGMEVTVVDNKGMQRTAIVGRVKIETRPLVLVEAKPPDSENEIYSILLQNAETVALVSPTSGEENRDFLAIPVTSLKIGDEILLRVQGGARHTGIEIKEFILEK